MDLQKVINSYVLHCLKSQKITHIFATRCAIAIGFGGKGSFNEQIDCVEKSRLNFADI